MRTSRGGRSRPVGRRAVIGGLLACVSALCVGLPPVSSEAVATAGFPCEVAGVQAVVPADTTIVAAEALDEPVPYCRIDGYVTTVDPGPNQVNFVLALPGEHNGRYYFQGLGGTAGYVPEPPTDLLTEGYAFVGTDTGNQSGGADASFMADPAKALDHHHRGGHVVAVVTQELTRKYYDTDRLYRYHSGCSGGGRMGYTSAALHPDDFDGILAGAGPRDTGGLIMHFGRVGQHLRAHPEGLCRRASCGGSRPMCWRIGTTLTAPPTA